MQKKREEESKEELEGEEEKDDTVPQNFGSFLTKSNQPNLQELMAMDTKIVMKEADKCELLNRPLISTANPLVIQALLNFCFIYNKRDPNDDRMQEEVKAMSYLDLLDFKGKFTLKNMFSKALIHFNEHLFPGNKDKLFEQLFACIYCARKGIKRSEIL